MMREKDGEEDTNNMSYSASFQVGVTRDLSDKFMRCKTGVAVRKFDDTLWPSGSWNEIWIAFDLRMNLPFPWKSSLSTLSSAGVGQMMIGVCNTNGLVYGERSASVDTSNQHFMGLYFNANNPAAAGSAGYTGSYAYAVLPAFPHVYVTGSYQTTAGFTNLYIPFTSGSEDRALFAMRFATHSVANQWLIYAYAPSGISAFNYPITSSSQVAEFFSQSSWGSITHAGYSYQSPQTLTTDRLVNGYFDGIFIGWQQWFEELHISNVVVRLL